MATVTPTITYAPGGHRNLVQVVWVMGDADTGVPVDIAPWADASVQIAGTFASATVVLQGSNDGTNYVTLTDPQGNALSKTAAAIEQILEMVRYLRPSTSGGSGAGVTITLLARRSQ